MDQDITDSLGVKELPHICEREAMHRAERYQQRLLIGGGLPLEAAVLAPMGSAVAILMAISSATGSPLEESASPLQAPRRPREAMESAVARFGVRWLPVGGSAQEIDPLKNREYMIETCRNPD